jgi:hypothetical protein
MSSDETGAWYEGIRYRSHTECCWAMFFKHLGIKAKYETQGFVTDGEPYLPDFLAWPALGPLWIEVKGDWETDLKGVAKWRRFVAQRPQPSRAALLSGKPAIEGQYQVIGGGGNDGDELKGFWEDDAYEWRPCPSGHHFDLAHPGTWRTKFADDGCPDDFGGGGEEKIRKAVEAVLSHRFGKGPGKKAA